MGGRGGGPKLSRGVQWGAHGIGDAQQDPPPRVRGARQAASQGCGGPPQSLGVGGGSPPSVGQGRAAAGPASGG